MHEHEHEHEHHGRCCGHHHGHRELSEAHIAFLEELEEHHFLPVVRFMVESSRERDFSVEALAPVYLRHKGETMEWVRETGEMLRDLEMAGYLTIDYGYALENYPYTEYRESELYAYFCRTIEEGRERPGFLGDTPVLELGSIAPSYED